MDRFGDWLILALYVAIVFLLVRPGSLGPMLVERVTGGLTSIITAVTGGGGWSGRG